MSRILRVAAAQLGPIQKADSRAMVVARMLALMEEAKAQDCDLVAFPELALTTFFPRWYCEDRKEMMPFFEVTMPNDEVQPLFDFAKKNKIGFYLGYAEYVAACASDDGEEHFYNSSILVDKDAQIVGNYRKIHLPGHTEYNPKRAHQHLEKRYFEVGDRGFHVDKAMNGNIGMALCNDRRWPETFRLLGLQDVELTLVGYNTPTHDSLSDEAPDLRLFHSQLMLQAGAYQNSSWVVGIAKAGIEDGHPLMGGSCIIAPTGEIVAQTKGEGDELIFADCDLDACQYYKDNIFNFANHRRPEFYGPIVQQTGRKDP